MDIVVFRAIHCAKMTTNLWFHKKQSRKNWNGSSIVNYRFVTLFQRAPDLFISFEDTDDKCKLNPNTERKKKEKKEKKITSGTNEPSHFTRNSSSHRLRKFRWVNPLLNLSPSVISTIFFQWRDNDENGAASQGKEKNYCICRSALKFADGR